MHRLLADFLVGDRVFEIVLESLGLSPEPSDSSFEVGYRASGSPIIPLYRVQPSLIATGSWAFTPCIRLTMGFRTDSRPRLGLEGPQMHVFRGSSVKLPTKWAKPRQNGDESEDFWGNAASR